MLDILLRIAFYVGATASVVFVILYGFRSSWRHSGTGRSIMALMGIIAIVYMLGVIALLWPEIFFGGSARWITLALRIAIDIVLVNMTLLLLRAQKRDREERCSDRGSRSRPDDSPLDR